MHTRGRVAIVLLAVCLRPAIPIQAGIVEPTERTADLPDSWLLLYNANDFFSRVFMEWYADQWGIPSENLIGLDTSSDERIHVDTFVSEIFDPVRLHLLSNPDLESRIMGIIVGYRVPGIFFADDTHPPLQGGGGWSVASNLQDLQYSWWYERDNPHVFSARLQGYDEHERLTKAELDSQTYMSARLDGPNANVVAALVERARAVSLATEPLPTGEHLLYDYSDPGAAPGSEWSNLRATVESDALTIPGWRYPWTAFESEVDPIPDCTMYFSYYRLTGWQNVPWDAATPGSRLVAYAFNSWGATTVRSTTDHGGRFVPNALEHGGFIAALGATAEPYVGNEPLVDTVAWCICQGWTVGEAFFRANPKRNHMWELVGDPLMRVPHWFASPPPQAPSDLGPPELVNGEYVVDATPTLTFVQNSDTPDEMLSYQIQLDNSSDFDSPVIDYTSDPQEPGAASFTVGQSAMYGSYAVGQEGQELTPSAPYYWRVRSHNGPSTGEWAYASENDDSAFNLLTPLSIRNAASRKTHTAAGTADIPLQLGPGAMTVEPRKDGATTLVVDFTRPAHADDGLMDETEVVITSGEIEDVTLDTLTLTIELSGILNKSCVSVSLQGISGDYGHPLQGPREFCVMSLLGDVTQDGVNNLLDASETKFRNGQPFTAENAVFDVNLDGNINGIDFAEVKTYNGCTGSCP